MDDHRSTSISISISDTISVGRQRQRRRRGGEFLRGREGGRGYTIKDRMRWCTLDKDRVNTNATTLSWNPVCICICICVRVYVYVSVSGYTFPTIPIPVPMPVPVRMYDAVCERLEGYSRPATMLGNHHHHRRRLRVRVRVWG